MVKPELKNIDEYPEIKNGIFIDRVIKIHSEFRDENYQKETSPHSYHCAQQMLYKKYFNIP